MKLYWPMASCLTKDVESNLFFDEPCFDLDGCEKVFQSWERWNYKIFFMRVYVWDTKTRVFDRYLATKGKLGAFEFMKDRENLDLHDTELNNRSDLNLIITLMNARFTPDI